MKHAQFSLACTMLFVAAANFVLALIALIKDLRDEKKRR